MNAKEGKRAIDVEAPATFKISPNRFPSVDIGENIFYKRHIERFRRPVAYSRFAHLVACSLSSRIGSVERIIARIATSAA
ncbi:hypothetical protein BQ8482_380070 [Mesorhizobium delmotii]|uniref:Uncharacterized protein n=1 Tax=Mesorhizobium delmotii TaxID=1631247 RepID=A0A2P9AS22_9HYPH|nr:hypothetical protein BQ8482_380070 [Mesorhizobium delmotii]